MEEWITYIRWFNLICYMGALFTLLWKFVFTATVNPDHEFDWSRFLLALHLLLGLFSVSEILTQDYVQYGLRTLAAAAISALTFWACIFKIKVDV